MDDSSLWLFVMQMNRREFDGRVEILRMDKGRAMLDDEDLIEDWQEDGINRVLVCDIVSIFQIDGLEDSRQAKYF